MSKECTTHHFACDCREEKFKDIERENKQLRQTVLETLSQRGQRELIVAWDRVKELERENASLRVDKERLDWLDAQGYNMKNVNMDGIWRLWQLESYEITESLRAAIDAERKEAQP